MNRERRLGRGLEALLGRMAAGAEPSEQPSVGEAAESHDQFAEGDGVPLEGVPASAPHQSLGGPEQGGVPEPTPTVHPATVPDPPTIPHPFLDDQEPVPPHGGPGAPGPIRVDIRGIDRENTHDCVTIVSDRSAAICPGGLSRDKNNHGGIKTV